MSHADVVDRIIDVSLASRARLRTPPSARRHLPIRRPVQDPQAIRRPVQEYEPEAPRTALGALAVAIAIVTLMALVVAPAALESAVRTLY